MDEKEIADLRRQAGIILTEAPEHRESLGTTHLIVELRSLAHKWETTKSRSGGDSPDYDIGCDNAMGSCADQLLDVIKKYHD